MDVRAAFVAQREAAEAMQPGQGAFDNPAEDAAATALSSGDDFKNGQKTPCLRTARTYTILTALAAGWFSNIR